MRSTTSSAGASEGLGTGTTGVEGIDAVVASLQQSQVQVLLVHPDGLDDRRLPVLAEAPWVAGTPGEQPVEELATVGAADALVRAAVLTDAEVLVLDDPHPQLGAGIAAVLRWSTPAEGDTAS
jgi:hypothetical protein